jgi:hypothetical protein
MLDPSVGRWLEEDPELFGTGDPNLYRPMGNDPTDKTDPTGLETDNDLMFRQFKQHVKIGGGQVAFNQHITDVLSGVNGEIEVRTGSSAEGVVGDSRKEWKGGISVQYKGTNRRRIDFVQFFWAEAKVFHCKGPWTEEPGRMAVPNYRFGVIGNYETVDPGPFRFGDKVILFDMPGRDSLYVDSRTDDPRINSRGGLWTYVGDDGIIMHDTPDLAQLAMERLRQRYFGREGIAWAQKVTSIDVAIHYATFLAVQGRALWELDWTSEGVYNYYKDSFPRFYINPAHSRGFLVQQHMNPGEYLAPFRKALGDHADVLKE